MNLVQINERLKGLPMQVIQQYANGMNPEVPPYLALGELQRREIAQKQMATAQGGQQGPQPSVKEQVEQKAGLMAAQGLQQQQAMQQMQQPRGPMPAPAGVPQPEMQPQPETMMARGGLAGAPVNFNFQHGGIVAFEEGGKASKYETPYDRMNRKNREEEERKKREPEQPVDAQAAEDRAMMARLLESLRGGSETAGRAIADVATMVPRGLVGAYDTAVVRPMRAAGVNAAYLAPKLTPEGASVGSMTPFTDVARAREAQRETPATPRMTSPQPTEQTYVRKAGPTPPAPIADLKALAEQKQRQQGPRPAQAAAASQATPGGQESPQAEVARLALEANRNAAKAMTPEEAMAQEGKFAAQYGLDKQFGEEERGLLAAMKQRQAQQAAGRPSAELGAVLRGFGQGYGGAGAAGERASQETFNADMAHQREMLNAINALNKTNLETGRERYKTSGNLFGEDRKSTSAANLQRAQTLGTMRGQDIQSQTQMRGQDMQLEATKIQAAATREARAQGADDKTIAAAEAAFARDPEAAAIKKRLESPIATVNPAKAQADIDRLRAIQASKYQQFGIKLEGAPGAAGPGGTTRMRFDAQGNPIK